MTKALAARCIARNRTGGQCKRKAIVGATVCYMHGGKTPKVAANAAVRAEVMQWGLTDVTADPGETLLRLVTQSAARAQRYADELEALVAESPSLREPSWVRRGSAPTTARATRPASTSAAWPSS